MSRSHRPAYTNLGQGDLIRYKLPNTPPKPSPLSLIKRDLDYLYKHFRETTFKILPAMQELHLVGGDRAHSNLLDILDEHNYLVLHHCCAAWSENVHAQLIPSIFKKFQSEDPEILKSLESLDLNNEEFYHLVGIDAALKSSLKTRCAFCSKYGASIHCKLCKSPYHYPCAIADGAFLEIDDISMICSNCIEKLDTTTLDDNSKGDSGIDAAFSGGACSAYKIYKARAQKKQLKMQLYCVTCGAHYDADDMDIIPSKANRAGWQCPDCKVCQGCRKNDNDEEMIICDRCDRGFHTYCIEPKLTEIPSTEIDWFCPDCEKGSTSLVKFSQELLDTYLLAPEIELEIPSESDLLQEEEVSEAVQDQVVTVKINHQGSSGKSAGKGNKKEAGKTRRKTEPPPEKSSTETVVQVPNSKPTRQSTRRISRSTPFSTSSENNSPFNSNPPTPSVIGATTPKTTTTDISQSDQLVPANCLPPLEPDLLCNTLSTGLIAKLTTRYYQEPHGYPLGPVQVR